MAKSGFVPAWMKIQSSDKTNGNQKLTINRTNNNNNNRQTQILNRSETNSTSSSPPILAGQQRNKSNDQSLTNGLDGQSENFVSFSSNQIQIRRSFSRERLLNTLNKNSEINDNDSQNGYRSINNSQRRLHSISSNLNDRQQLNNHHPSPNDINSDRLETNLNDDREKIHGNNDYQFDTLMKTNEHEQNHHSNGFDCLEQDFPSLNGQERNKSSINDQSSSIWNNAATKLRASNTETYKVLDRSLSNNSRLFGSNRILSRKDRLLNTLNNSNSTSSSLTTILGSSNRSIQLELQTNCKTQTKNLDKRSDFFNSLKNDSINERNKTNSKRQINESIKPKINTKTSKGTLLFLSVPETSEEKELLIRMGWKEFDDINYEITDKDKEEYELQLKHLPKNGHTSTALMSALNRRTLPYIDIRDFLRFERINSTSDDDSSDE